MYDAAFALEATHTCTIMAPPPVVGGKRGDPVLVVSATACYPLEYVSAQAAQRLGLDSPARLRQTMIDGVINIPRGAYLLMDGEPKQYPIKSTDPEDWRRSETQYTVVVVESPEA